MMTTAPQPSIPQPSIPRPDELNLDFYRAIVAANKLCIQRCTDCGTWTHPARYYCPSCSSPEFSFEETSGRATVHSYTVSHYSVEAAWKPLLPYVTIVAELQEGPRIVAAARDIAPDVVAIGMPLQIVTENKSADFAFFWAAQDTGES
jgi:uncharacterized OB-fold protein